MRRWIGVAGALALTAVSAGAPAWEPRSALSQAYHDCWVAEAWSEEACDRFAALMQSWIDEGRER